MTTRALTTAFFLAATAPALHAFGIEGGPNHVETPNLGSLLVDWRLQNGAEWRLQGDGQTGHLEMLFGGHTRATIQPRDDADFVGLARQALANTVAMHGIPNVQLEAVEVAFLPLGIIGSTDKTTVRFRQLVNGVPVDGGAVNVLFDMEGRLLSIQTHALPRVANFITSPAVTAERAVASALQAFQDEQGVEPTIVGEPQLVVDQFFDGEQRIARLAWKIDLQWHADGVAPIGREWRVDAQNNAAYRSTESVHFFDISGSVSSLATPGVLPDVVSNPATSQPMRFLRVQSGATTTFTDTNGNFTLPGVNAPANATFTYVGTYQNVVATGGSYSLTLNLPAASGNVVTMNSPAAALVTAQANCMRVIPMMRDFIKSISPTDTHADIVFRANTAVSGTCNAYYDGGSINFFSAAGGCVNSAYSTVISHEHGHWMNDRYGTGNGGDGMGEGNGDVWAMYIHDTPIVGQDFQGTSDIRTGLNNTAFCGDANSSCYGEVHADGEPWMGAAWKVRARLNVSLGNAPGDLVANTVFVGWMNAYNQTEIKSIIETQWLTLDDNNGNINDGTPHFTDIDGGFRDQQFPGVILLPVAISSVTDLADTTNQIGPYTVNATIVANVAPPLTNQTLFWRSNGGAFNPVPMTLVSGNVYRGQIPGITAPAVAEYYVSATNSSAQTGVFPAGAPASLLDFDVGVVHILRFDNFDSPSDMGWTHGTYADTGSASEDWQRETPAGKTGTGWADPSAAYSPSTAWGTDMGNGSTSFTVNGAYTSNIHEWLRSPIINCAGATGVRLSFRRWLSVQGSASDQARVRVNNTQIYINPATTLNDGAWVSQEFDISALADNNPSVQLEWELKANGSTNFGGWNVDDVKVRWIESVCTPPVNYCITSPNSVGSGATMTYNGSTRVANNDFELIATNCPAATVGIFFYGQNSTQVPFGNGFRCVGGSVYRLPIVGTDAFGDAHFPINLTGTLPHAIVAGEQWRFQYWYRNPAGGGAGFNLSDGLLTTWCP